MYLCHVAERHSRFVQNLVFYGVSQNTGKKRIYSVEGHWGCFRSVVIESICIIRRWCIGGNLRVFYHTYCSASMWSKNDILFIRHRFFDLCLSRYPNSNDNDQEQPW